MGLNDGLNEGLPVVFQVWVAAPVSVSSIYQKATLLHAFLHRRAKHFWVQLCNRFQHDVWDTSGPGALFVLNFDTADTISSVTGYWSLVVLRLLVRMVLLAM